MDNEQIIEYLKSLSAKEQDEVFDIVKKDQAVTEKETVKDEVTDDKKAEDGSKEDKIDNEQKVEDKEVKTEETETKTDESKDETDNSEPKDEQTEDKETEEEITEETTDNEVVDDTEMIDIDNIVQKDYLNEVLGEKFGSIDSRFSSLEKNIESILDRFMGSDFGNEESKGNDGVKSSDSWAEYKKKFM